MDYPAFSTRKLCVAVSLVVAAAAARPARAELTVENLVSTAVQGVGPYFQDVADAIRKFAARDYDGAFKLLENAKKTTPRLAPPEVMMAQLYLDAGMNVPAYGMLEKAIKTAPQDPEPCVIFAERALLEGRLSDAGPMFSRAAKLAEPFTDNPRRRNDLMQRILLGSATVDERRGEMKDAKAKLEALIKLDQRNAAAHEKLGKVLFALGDQRKALEAFQAAAETDPKMMPAGLSMAYLVTDRGQAEKWVNYALSKSAGDVRTQVAAAGFLLRGNQVDEALSHAKKALELEPNNAEAQTLAGLLSRLKADYPAAANYLSKAHLASPLSPVVLNNLALVLLEMPDNDSKQRALQYAELGLKYNPNQIEALTTLGWINYRLKKRREADRAFNAAINSPEMASSGVMTSEMAYYLANFARDQGNVKEAISLLTDALNTEMPFGYRRAAEDLLAELNKLQKPEKSKSDKPSTPAKPSEGATTARANGSPAAPAAESPAPSEPK